MSGPVQPTGNESPLSSSEFLQLLPKVDLHCHIIGTVDPETVVDLARKHGVALTRSDPATLYDIQDQPTAEKRELRLFELLEEIARVLIDREDFARVAYELIERFAVPHNVRYLEIFVNPTAFEGVAYPVVVDGLIDGLAAAEEQFGIRANLVPAILREQGSAAALALVEEIVANPRDRVLGIAIDGNEDLDVSGPRNFAEAYRVAGEAGLRRTAHATLVPPEDVEACLDVLGCDRLDHGYRVLESPQLTERLIEQGTAITVCETVTRVVFGATDERWNEVSTHPARTMIEAGLPVTIGTDDPALISTHASQEYEALLGGDLFDSDLASAVSLAGVAATWLDATDREALAAEFSEEIALLRSRLDPTKESRS